VRDAYSIEANTICTLVRRLQAIHTETHLASLHEASGTSAE